MTNEINLPLPGIPETPEQKKAVRPTRIKKSHISDKYMTLRACSEHFCVDESTIRKGCGNFARLKMVKPTRGLILVLRSSIDELDKKLANEAQSIHEVLTGENRKPKYRVS